MPRYGWVLPAAVVALASCGGSPNNSGPLLSAPAGSPASSPITPTGSSTSPPAALPTAAPTTAPGAGTAFVITISNLRFSPLNLSVSPGATITVVNMDAMAHSVTSEASSGAFIPGSVAGVSFDTGEFSSGTRTFTIPAGAAAGTVIPFFCVVHRQAMTTPTGSIIVDPGATPSPTNMPTQSPDVPAPMPMPMMRNTP